MSETSRWASRHRVLALTGVAGLAIGTVVTSTPAIAEPDAPRSTYIVQLAGLPAASYEGGTGGYSPTSPDPGEKIDVSDEAVEDYRDHLVDKHEVLLDSVPSAEKIYDYTLTFNGFAAEMTSVEAAKLSDAPGVLAVTKDEIRQVDTISTPDFLGLTDRGGLWDQLGGPGRRGAGDGVVVGLLDTGIWPESESFDDLRHPKKVNDWNGICQEGEEWPSSTCNNKIIGARYYTAGFGGPETIKELFPFEYVSARDADGHGTHTSSTAAGNFGVEVEVDGMNLGKASGMAPNARIAMYKVCWGRDEGGCATSDSMQAIEDATADGVDVLNFSISGSRTSMVDPVELQMLFAADAGVFVAMSAGNTPGTSTVAHNDPWVTTVAAGTHDRAFVASATLGDGRTFQGAGLGDAVPATAAALSSEVGLPDADPEAARLCTPGTLDPAAVSGKIIVCDRGIIARVAKSQAVAQAGGVGMILANQVVNSLNADLHSVPTVHVNLEDGAAIKDYVGSTANPTIALAAGEKRTDARAPAQAGFSSSGPALASADLLKPDILAPGVDVLAAVSPDRGGRNFDFLSGTSMSSPHIAGIGALLTQLHPKWSPMAIKSAILTSATTRDNAGQPIVGGDGATADPFDIGSGLVQPNGAAHPGLVYDNGFEDWVQFLCGAGQLALGSPACEQFGSIDPSDLNTPNIAIGELTGTQTVTRTVTSVSRFPMIYIPIVDEPAGVDVNVSPPFLFLWPHQERTFEVTFTRTDAAFDEWAFGSLSWFNGFQRVRSQLVVRPVAVAAPAAVSGTGTSGSVDLSVQTGYDGTLNASTVGLVPAAENTQNLTNPTGGSFDTANPTVGDHTARFTITVPEGASHARLATIDADYPTGTDLDLFLYEAGTTNQVGQSATGTSDEQINLVDPAPGQYDLYVDLFALAPGESSVDATALSWVLAGQSAGNLTVEPASQPVSLAGTTQVTASWSGLEAGQRYLGQVVYGDGSGPLGTTVVRVDA